MKSVKHIAVSVAICLVVTLVTVLIIRGYSYFGNIIEDFRGYDYDSKIAKQYDWIGPKPGEIIDSNHLVNISGVSLEQFPKKELLLLTVVDPECPACKQSEEQLHFLQNNLTKEGIDYFIVCFSKKVSPSELSDYVRSLSLPSTSFSWADDFNNVLPSIKSIVFPSHILIDSKGFVIKTFPGTSNDKRIRDRMVRQVLNEVVAYKDRNIPQN